MTSHGTIAKLGPKTIFSASLGRKIRTKVTPGIVNKAFLRYFTVGLENLDRNIKPELLDIHVKVSYSAQRLLGLGAKKNSFFSKILGELGFKGGKYYQLSEVLPLNKDLPECFLQLPSINLLYAIDKTKSKEYLRYGFVLAIWGLVVTIWGKFDSSVEGFQTIGIPVFVLGILMSGDAWHSKISINNAKEFYDYLTELNQKPVDPAQ